VATVLDNATTALSGPAGIVVAGRYAYVGGSDDDGLEVLDISNPTNPVHKGVVFTPLDNPRWFCLSGKHAYVACGRAIDIVNIPGIDAPAATIGSIDTSTLQVSENMDVKNDMSVGSGLIIGQSGIFSAGPVAIKGSGTTNLFALRIMDHLGFDRFTVMDKGNVGIGSTLPSRTLFVQGQIGCSDAGAAKHVFDIAEVIPVSGVVGEGDILVLNPEKSREAMRSYKPDDPLVIGVVSAQSDAAKSRGIFFLGDTAQAEKATGKKHVYFSVAGQVEVNVSLENGAISMGDWITTSSIPGVGMKATGVRCVVGKALEPFSGGQNKEQTGKILVLISIL
jgi:hypothetical protein